MAEPEKGLQEAYRVLRVGGRLAIFDADSTTTSVATGDHDPLQSCVGACVESVVNDKWFVRRLPQLLRRIGYIPGPLRSYGFSEVDEVDYMLTIVDRGVDALVASKRIGPQLAKALRDEARRRVDAGEFFGQGSWASVVATKPD
jgi:hypothetical protein